GDELAPRREGADAGRPGLDPLLEDEQLVLAGPRPLARRRHLPGLHALVKFRLGRAARDDLVAGDELIAVEGVTKSPLGGAVFTVTAVAVGLQDGLGPVGQGRGVGTRGGGQAKEHDYRQAAGAGVHVRLLNARPGDCTVAP